MSPPATVYDVDFAAWTQEQAALLREGAVHELDLPNLAEEIESVGISEHRAVQSHLVQLVLHLLKWAYQPRRRSRSWASSIIHARDEIAQILERSPSIENHLPTYLDKRYRTARRLASVQTRLPLATFPVTCPWPLAQILDDDFWPEGP